MTENGNGRPPVEWKPRDEIETAIAKREAKVGDTIRFPEVLNKDVDHPSGVHEVIIEGKTDEEYTRNFVPLHKKSTPLVESLRQIIVNLIRK